MTNFNQPLGGNDMARFARPAMMMRLPSQPTVEGLDLCFVGVPLDTGTSNHSGTGLNLIGGDLADRQYRGDCGELPFRNAVRPARRQLRRLNHANLR